MSTEKKSSRELLREKIGAIAETRKAAAFSRLREVAAKHPGKAGEALGELAYGTNLLASSLSNLREQLDLSPPPRAASLRARMAARKGFAAAFRQVSETNPEQLAEAVIELYRSVDEIVSGIENFAANMGIDLPDGTEDMTELPEGLEADAGLPGDEGMPEGFPPEGLEAEGEEKETPEQQAKEDAEGTKGGPEDKEQDEGLAGKSAADSAGFVTDRDKDAKPKAVDKAEIPQSQGEAAVKKATGAGGFVTNRDQGAEPKPVEKAEIPVSQGEAAIKLGTDWREKAGW